jgi:hypothetical protein
MLLNSGPFKAPILRSRPRRLGLLAALSGNFAPPIGKDERGASVVEAFQYGGGHPDGLLLGGAWCCFHVSGLDWISINGDDWRSGADSERHSEWVVDVDISS